MLTDEKEVTKEELVKWNDSIHEILPYDSILFNTSLKLTGNKITTTSNTELLFFDSERFIKTEKEFTKLYWEHTESWKQHKGYYLWKEFQIDSLHFVMLYANYNEYKKEHSGEIKLNNYGFLIPKRNGGYYSSFGEINDIQCFEDITKDFSSIAQRKDMFDTDTIRINDKYGLYTLFGKEVLPAIYDSIRIPQYGYFATAYKGDSISFFTYWGKPIIENMKAVTYLTESFQVLNKDNQMVYLDLYGNEIPQARNGRILTGDEILPFYPGTHILRKKKKVRDSDCFVKVIECWYSDLLEYEPFLLESFNIKPQNWIEFVEMVNKYGLEEEIFKGYTQKAFKEYIVEVYPLPKGYKILGLANNKESSYYSSDWIKLPDGLLIARRKGKYGVLNIYEPEEAVLPFIYKRITGVVNNWYEHLLLEKGGLKCYYPLHSDPRYKKLERFQQNFARFELSDGRTGWLGLNGKEYFD